MEFISSMKSPSLRHLQSLAGEILPFMAVLAPSVSSLQLPATLLISRSLLMWLFKLRRQVLNVGDGFVIQDHQGQVIAAKAISFRLDDRCSHGSPAARHDITHDMDYLHVSRLWIEGYSLTMVKRVSNLPSATISCHPFLLGCRVETKDLKYFHVSLSHVWRRKSSCQCLFHDAY